MEANGAACAKTGSHAPKGGGTQGAVPGPCEFVETGGSACDAEGPGVNAKPQGKGVGVLAMHAVGATQKGRGGRGGERERIGGRIGGGTGEHVRVRARAFAAADKASGLARVPDRPPPAYGSV